MAYPLTARSLQLNSANAFVSLLSTSEESIRQEQLRKQNSSPATSSGDNGNMADRESTGDDSEFDWLLSINSTAKNNKRRRGATSPAEVRAAKQAKLREDRYAAATAKEDVAKLAVPYMAPTIGTNERFNGSINLTEVKHMVSNAAGEKTSGHVGYPNARTKHDIETAFGVSYMQMIEQSRQFYPSGAEISANNSNTVCDVNSDISPSNQSDDGTDSDETTMSGPSSDQSPQIPSLLTTRKYEDNQEDRGDNDRAALSLKCFPSSTMSISESLSLSSDARLVTGAASPHKIVHANAAFCRLSGMDSTDCILGRPLAAVISSIDADGALSLTSCHSSSIKEVKNNHAWSVNVTGRQKQGSSDSNGHDGGNTRIPVTTKCCMTIAPVVVDGDSKEFATARAELANRSFDFRSGEELKDCIVTHYAVKLVEHSDDAAGPGERSVTEAQRLGWGALENGDGVRHRSQEQFQPQIRMSSTPLRPMMVIA